ncbi:MAG: LysR family transcriptional regulator [Myxococcota bacterium]
MNWEDLRYILAVAREGTVLAAAKSLGVSPTTMARRLRSLQDDQGTALFEKFKHGTVLNEAGERVVAVAEQVERLTDELDAAIHGLDQKLEGSIRVTSVNFLLRYWIRDFGAFRDRYPNVDLELTSTTSVVNLTQREADIALRIAPTAPDHLLGGRHAELLYCIYGSEDLVAKIGADAPYSAFPWLSWDLAFARTTDEWIAANAAGADIVLRLGQMNVMEQAVEAGLGITIMPCLIGDTNPKLRRIGDYFEGGLYLWVLTHPQLRGSARMTTFTRFVRELIRRDHDLIEGRRPFAAED